MKKRIITLLAVLALLVVCAVFAVQATETTELAYIDLATFKCPCSDCNGNPYTGTWKTAYSTAPADGDHYYFKGTGKDSYLAPGGGMVPAANAEVVIVFDNIYAVVKGTGRAITAYQSGVKMHLIGNNASFCTRSTGADVYGPLAYIVAGSEVHMYGDLEVKKDNTAGSIAEGGLVFVNNGKLHIHDCDGMNLPTTKDPVLTAPAMAGKVGGICKLTSANCQFIMDAGTLNGSADCGNGAVIYNKAGTVQINGGTINGGNAATGFRGGIIYNAAGTTTITGGELKANADMTGQYRGIYVGGGALNFAGGTIISANKGVGDGIAIMGGTALTLSGNATVQNAADAAEATKVNNIYRWKDDSNTSVIQVDSGWSGTASVDVGGFALEEHGQEFATDVLFYGSLDSNNAFINSTTQSVAQPNLFLENAAHENPRLYAYAEKFYACRAQVYKNGKATGWYLTPAEAVDVCKIISGDSVKVWADHASTIKSDVYMDLNGYNLTKLTLNDGVKLYAFDSAAEAGEAGASINVAAQPYTQINGKTYVVNNGVVYPVELKIASVSLRPSTDGSSASMYYTASIKAAAEAGIKNYGVAVTVDAEADKLTEDYLYTQTEGTPAAEYNGVLVQNIVANGKDGNKGNAETAIFAQAYVTLADDSVCFSTAANKTLAQVVADVVAKDPAAEGWTGDQITAVDAMKKSDWYAEITA